MSHPSTVCSVRIATRASPLALWQAEHVAQLLRQAEPAVAVEIVHVSTVGDREQSEALRNLGGFGAFTREVQRAVSDGRADLAVHSLKDLPVEPTPGLVLAGIPARGPMFDALVFPLSRPDAHELADLPHAARVGTGSLRRQAQLWFARPDLQMTEVRGNVDTRLRKLDAGDYDALVLAGAGLIRLGLHHRISAELHPPQMHAAVGQGALGLECRAEDTSLQSLLRAIDDAATRAAVTAERALLRALRAGCHAPVGVASRTDGEHLRLEAVVLDVRGTQRLVEADEGLASAAEDVGRGLAARLIARGALELMGTV